MSCCPPPPVAQPGPDCTFGGQRKKPAFLQHLAPTSSLPGRERQLQGSVGAGGALTQEGARPVTSSKGLKGEKGESHVTRSPNKASPSMQSPLSTPAGFLQEMASKTGGASPISTKIFPSPKIFPMDPPTHSAHHSEPQLCRDPR